MILGRSGQRVAVEKPQGLPMDAALAWLGLHLGIEAAPAADLDDGSSGVLPLDDGDARPGHLVLLSHVLLADAAASAALPDEFRQGEGDRADGGAPNRTLFRRLDTRTLAGRPVTAWQAIAAAPAPGQVRRHAAAAGLPILGDRAHGGPAWPRLALHVTEARWPDLAEPFTSPEPASFRAPDAAALALAAALERRAGWPAAVGEAWRCVHRDELPGLPAAVDVYGAWLNATWFDEDTPAAEAEAALHPVLEALAAATHARGAVVRLHRRNPHQQGLRSPVRIVGEAPPDTILVREHGLVHEVNLARTQHTGLFPDQRDARRLVGLAAAGARVANLFAFTCSFSLAAAAAGCEVVFSVDTAKGCLETGKANFAHNGLQDSGRGKFIQQDARRWLARQIRRRDERPAEHRPLDIVICDPPVFASSEDGGAFAVEEAWAGLAADAAGLLSGDGFALFANNHRGGDHARYAAELRACFGSVTEIGQPLDFPLLPGHERHVRTFLCRDPRA